MKEFSQHPHPLPKVSVFLASSLDGFIARSDGSLDWLDQANTHVPQGEDCGFQDFFASTDVLVLGRKGSGIRCLGEVNSDVQLQLLGSHSYEFGYLQLRYRLPTEATS